MVKKLWSDRKRWIIGVPWTFTKYTLTENKFIVETGLLNSKQYDVRLYRITNINSSRNLIQKIFKIGTVHIDSNDKDLKSFDIVNIRDSKEVAELLSEQVEEERLRNRVTAREYMVDDHEDDDEHDFIS